MKNLAKSFQKALVLCFFVLNILPGSAPGQWQKLADLSDVPSVVKFFNPSFGLIGNGGSPGGHNGIAHAILRTTDGGHTWANAIIPSTNPGEVTDFFMMDSLNGWASIIDWPDPSCGLWRTFDGGMTWQETSLSGAGSSVHLTSKALIVPDLFSHNHISVDSGRSWHTLSDGSKNDVEFASDLFGISSTYRGGNWRITRNGGLTWNAINQNIESWSLAIDKNTGTIMATPEGNSDGSNPQPPGLFVSHDSGSSWQKFLLPPFTTTGHIGVAGDKIVFVQECMGDPTQTGFFMTRDGGKTWTDIGGPQAFNDTRFSILYDCGGNEGDVYAFDDHSLYRYHFIIDSVTSINTSTARFSAGRIINDSVDVIVHLPVYFHHTGKVGDIDMTVHYPTESLQLMGTSLYNWKNFDVGGTQTPGVASLHFAAADLNAAPDSTLGYLHFFWKPFEYSCNQITFGPISMGDSPCSNAAPQPFQGIIGSFKTCGQSSVAEELMPLPDFTVHPNPARSSIQIDLGNTTGRIRYELFDVLGIARKNGITSETTFTIDLTGLAEGNYYLRISGNNGAVATKQVVLVK